MKSLICTIDRHSLATTMTMTRFHVVAIAAVLLLAGSVPGFAAKRMSDSNSAVKSQPRETRSSGSAIRPYGRGAYAYGRGAYARAYASDRGAYAYGRDPSAYNRTDPYAPGVNWPKFD
jgi:hypothetical protein